MPSLDRILNAAVSALVLVHRMSDKVRDRLWTALQALALLALWGVLLTDMMTRKH